MLVKDEVIYHDDVQKVLGPRKWKSRTDEIMELNKKDEDKRIGVSSSSESAAKSGDSDNTPDLIDDDPGIPPVFDKEEE